MAWRTTWTKSDVLLGWLCSSPGCLISLPPTAGWGPGSAGGDGAVAVLRRCCPFIVTGLGHPILLVTGLSYVHGSRAQPCLLSRLLGEQSSLRPVPTAQGWQSPRGSSPCPALSALPPALTLPHSPPAPGQEPHNMAECCLGPAAPRLLIPPSFSIPLRGCGWHSRNGSSAAATGWCFQASGEGPPAA